MKKKITIHKIKTHEDDQLGASRSQSFDSHPQSIQKSKSKRANNTSSNKTSQSVKKENSSTKQRQGSVVKKREEEQNQKIKKSKQLKQLKKFQDDEPKLSQDQTQDVKISINKFELKKIQQYDEKIDPQVKSKYEQRAISPNDPETPKYRSKKVAKKLKDIEQKANEAGQIILMINQAYEQDVRLYDDRKIADKKLKCVIEIQKKLKDVIIEKQFMKQNGYILFIKWLSPNQITDQQTSLTVKIKVFNLILDLKFTKQNIMEAELLQKQIKKFRKSRFRTLRDIAQRILNKWRNIKALPLNN